MCTIRLTESTVSWQNSKPVSCKMHAFFQNAISFALFYSGFVWSFIYTKIDWPILLLLIRRVSNCYFSLQPLFVLFCLKKVFQYFKYACKWSQCFLESSLYNFQFMLVICILLLEAGDVEKKKKKKKKKKKNRSRNWQCSINFAPKHLKQN